jgi:hypothetical protein
MQHNFHNVDWSWQYFHQDGSKYRHDKYHKNAWCKACVHARSQSLREVDIQKADAGAIGVIRSDDEYQKQGQLLP